MRMMLYISTSEVNYYIKQKHKNLPILIDVLLVITPEPCEISKKKNEVQNRKQGQLDECKIKTRFISISSCQQLYGQKGFTSFINERNSKSNRAMKDVMWKHGKSTAGLTVCNESVNNSIVSRYTVCCSNTLAINNIASLVTIVIILIFLMF